MDLVSGVYAAKALAVAHELDLFSRLSGTEGLTFDEFAAQQGLHRRPAELLLTACAALGLLERRGMRFVNSPLAEEYLVRGKPFYFGGWIEMADRREFPAWLRLNEAMRDNRPKTWDPNQQRSLFDGEDPVLVEIFWEAMYSLSISSSQALADAVDFGSVRHLLDVGGGGAANDITLCRRHPRLRSTVFDLPFVCELTKPKIDKAGLNDRIAVCPGDFLSPAALPSGHDAILLSLVLHDWDEDDCRTILAKCHDALAPGGRIVITDLLVNNTKDGPTDAALMSLNMLIETWGRNYTAAEYSGWLTDVGCTNIDVVRFDAVATNGAVIGHKP